MRIFTQTILASLAVMALSIPASALPDGFTNGPVFEDFGPNAALPDMVPVPEGAAFKVVYDTTGKAKDGETARSTMTLARFINMHVRAGVALENIDLALVVHGSAIHDFVAPQADAPLTPHLDTVKALLDSGAVRIIICGQSAASQQVSVDSFYPGVEVYLSAMTAHALLQQDGYTTNPF